MSSSLPRLGPSELECPGETLVVPTDVRDEAAVERLADMAVERLGAIDLWVNSAGVMAYGRFDERALRGVPHDHRDQLPGQVHGARAALSQFRRQGSGRLINLSSA